jgi:uncharacterized alkaline shock family protein YloU
MTDMSFFTGRTTIAPEVLVSIVKLTVLGVEGVSQLAAVPGRVNRIFKREANDGVEITVENNTVYAEVFVIFKRDVNVREASRNIQNQVARAVKEMVGMEVGKVNVHVEDIDYRSEPAHK